MIIGNKRACSDVISLYEELVSEVLTGSWNSITLCSVFLTKTAAHSIIDVINSINTRRKIKFTIIVGIKTILRYQKLFEF